MRITEKQILIFAILTSDIFLIFYRYNKVLYVQIPISFFFLTLR